MFLREKDEKNEINLCIWKLSSNFAAGFGENPTKSCRGGGIGRHEGLKILWPVMAVRVQVPPAVPRVKKKIK